jgi:hypothetical protein
VISYEELEDNPPVSVHREGLPHIGLPFSRVTTNNDGMLTKPMSEVVANWDEVSHLAELRVTYLVSHSRLMSIREHEGRISSGGAQFPGFNGLTLGSTSTMFGLVRTSVWTTSRCGSDLPRHNHCGVTPASRNLPPIPSATNLAQRCG